MPPVILPEMYDNLVEDIKFTRAQDDVKNPEHFDYEYLLVFSK